MSADCLLNQYGAKYSTTAEKASPTEIWLCVKLNGVSPNSAFTAGAVSLPELIQEYKGELFISESEKHTVYFEFIGHSQKQQGILA